MNTNVEPVLEDEDSILAFTHSKRKVIVGELMKDNKLPVEPDDRKLLLGTLKDMDSAALGRKRIKVEEQANNNQEQAASIIAQMFAAASGRRPYQVAQPVERPVPMLGNEVPEPEVVDGEMDMVAAQGSVEEFMTRMSTPE